MKNFSFNQLHLQKTIFSELTKKIIIDILILLSILITFVDICEKYSTLSVQLIFNHALPYFDQGADDTFFIKHYCFYWMNIIPDEPLTFVTHTIPFLKNDNHFTGLSDQDVAGYFDVKKESEQFIYNDETNYTPKLPTIKKMNLSEKNFKDSYFILRNFVTGDAELKIDTDLLKRWDFYKLMTVPLRINEKVNGPKVLIFHTHAREKYAGGKSVVDVGESLKQELEKKYGVETMHVTDAFYADDSGSVTHCYEIMEKSIEKVLKDNPSIQICIDIHRDGINGSDKFVDTVNNKKTAKMMFVNGLCMNRDLKGELVEMEELKNKYLADNLAFSFQAQAEAYKYYPQLIKKIYFKEYRYSLHMKPLSLLVEIGNQNNSGEEACNTAEPLADIIAKVLEKD